MHTYELVLVCEIQKSAQCHIDGAKCIFMQYLQYELPVCIMISDTDTSALHQYLCTLMQNGHKYCELLTKRPLRVMFSNDV